MFSRVASPLVNLLMFRKITMIVFLLLLAPGMAFAMGKGGSGGGGGTGGGGGGSGADYDVVIVGAGTAGLYAAYELDSMGFSVKVMEARPRHGGALWHQDGSSGGPDLIGDTILDVIAESVTGPASKNWHHQDVFDLDPNRLVVKSLADTEFDDYLHSIEGTTIRGDDVSKAGNPELYDYWDFYNKVWKYQGDDVSVETYVCETIGVCRGESPFFKFYAMGYPGADYTVPTIDVLGMRSLGEQESKWTIGGGVWSFVQPYTWLGTLDELYFNGLLDSEGGYDPALGSKIQVAAHVHDVDTSGDVAEVVSCNARGCHRHDGDRDLDWTTDNHPYEEPYRTTVTADAVLVTVSLGVLKNGDIAFTPPLSAAKQNAINDLGFGTGGKMFLQFSSQVWPAEIGGGYTENSLCGYWWTYEYKGGEGNTVVICYAVGETGNNLRELPDDTARITAALADLDLMYSGTGTGTIFTDAFEAGFWKDMDRMQHSRGAYSFPTIDSYPTDGSPIIREALAAPESTMLYFAGEATSIRHPANVTGAMESGLRAAGEIDADHDPSGGGGSGGIGGSGGTGGIGGSGGSGGSGGTGGIGGSGGTGGGGTMHVDNIVVVEAATQGPWRVGSATITIVDGGGSPVSGATVDASYSGSNSGSTSGTTNGSGNVTLQSSESKRSWSGQFCVDAVTLGGSTYSPGDNVETCDSTP